MPFRCFAVCHTSCFSTSFVRTAPIPCYITSFMLPRFRFMRLLTAHTQFSMAFIDPFTKPYCDKSTCFTAIQLFAARHLRFTSLHSFQYCTVYPLSMFVLACAACQGFGFVMVFAPTHKTISKIHAKTLRNT